MCQDDVAVLLRVCRALEENKERKGCRQGGGVGKVETNRISTLEVAPEHALVGGVNAELLVEERLEEGLRRFLVRLVCGHGPSYL